MGRGVQNGFWAGELIWVLGRGAENGSWVGKFKMGFG